jgi:uracil-DNA glycosylase family 4
MLDICTQCPLYQHHNGLSQYVRPTSNLHSRYCIIGEAPGEWEVKAGTPFVGDAGREQDNYLALANLSRGLFHIRNIVQCRPPKNRDPHSDEISCCENYLHHYLEENRPEVIGAVGRFAARWFLGDDLSMEYSHGIPYYANICGYTTVVVPIYHPAAGMRSTTLMELIRQDYEALGRAIRHETLPRPYPPTTTIVSCADFAHFPTERPDVIAIDTETLPDGSPWCLTYCLDDVVYRGRIVFPNDTDALGKLNNLVSNPSVTTVLHNALYDLGVLARMGVYPATVHDTMVMSYLLQDLPLGLKPLSYRLVDMKLRQYLDVTAQAQQEKSLEYLLTASELPWPDPEQILVWDRGQPKIKKPQNISRKIARLLKAYSEDPAYDLASKWHAIDITGGRGQVEDLLGPMPEASLEGVDRSDAIQYACTDAVATYKIYPILRARLDQMQLWDTFNRDMAMAPVVAEMMKTGILLDTDALRSLDSELEEKKSSVEMQIQDLTQSSKHLNLASTQQVARTLFNLGVYPNPKLSTDSKTLDLYRGKHPIVNLITKYRELDKLQTTYTRPLQHQPSTDGRVHSRFSTTNTATGRLASSKPNLQNIPTRTPEGRRIRDAFIAPDGCSLASLDYSQIEMRCMAHVAEDQTMIQMFLDDLDIHSETAARMFKIPIDQVDKSTHRRPAKSVGFGVAYGMGPKGLQDQMRSQGVEYSERECQDLIMSWFGVYPKIFEYMDRTRAEARRYGLVRDYFGRYRLVPEVMSVHQRIVNAGLRQAGNFPIQSMAQQIIKQAMVDLIPIYTEFRQGDRYRCHIILQIHDELVWEISDDILEMAVPVIQSTMESAVELCMPTPVDYNIGHNWGELK